MNLIAIAFRIINFVLFIYGAWYLFKKYARQSIEDEIAQQEATQEQIIAQRANLEESIESLKADRTSLQTIIKDLSNKAHLWNNHTTQTNETLEIERKHHLEKLKKTVQTQQAVYKERVLQTAALQSAVEVVEKQMRQSINQTNAASQMQHIIKNIAK